MDYLPAESNTGMFGGNSNWRGPVWMPVNVLIIRALLNFYLYYGDNFKIECPTGSGKLMNLFEVSKEISGPPHKHLPSRRARPATRLRRHGEVPDRPTLARLHPLLRVLPRRQWRGARRQPPDRLDRASRQDYPTLRPPGRQAVPGSREKGRLRGRRLGSKGNNAGSSLREMSHSRQWPACSRYDPPDGHVQRLPRSERQVGPSWAMSAGRTGPCFGQGDIG